MTDSAAGADTGDSDESAGLFSDITQTFGSQSDAVHTGLIAQPPNSEAATGLIGPVSESDAATGLISPVSESDAPTGLIRRAPTGRIPVVSPGDAPTGLIRRAPTGSMPAINPEAASVPAVPAPEPVTPRRSIPKPPAALTAACVTATMAVLSGWAIAVMATILIAGYWRSDQLFCVAIGFLAAVAASATIGGQIAVLLRRSTGRIVVVVGAVVALLIFASLFIAGATLPTIAYFIPVLPVATIIATALPATGRWCTNS